MMQSEKTFSSAQVEAIAQALGHTTDGLTGSEIGHLLGTCRIDDVSLEATKSVRLHDAFATKQNGTHNRRAILEFIRQSMQPSRHLGKPERFEIMRTNLNRVLALPFSRMASSNLQNGRAPSMKPNNGHANSAHRLNLVM